MSGSSILVCLHPSILRVCCILASLIEADLSSMSQRVTRIRSSNDVYQYTRFLSGSEGGVYLRPSYYSFFSLLLLHFQGKYGVPGEVGGNTKAKRLYIAFCLLPHLEFV
jgi:hypothetical protein